MKNILQLITLSETGGSQKIVYNIIKGLHKEHNITLACAPSGSLIEDVRKVGVKVFELHNMTREVSLVKDLKTLIELIKIIKIEKIEVIHCHTWKACVLGRLAAKLCGMKEIYITIHGWNMLYSPSKAVRTVYYLIEKLFAYITTKIVCVCEADLKLGVHKKIASADKFITIYNAIEEKTEKCLDQETELSELPENSIIVGTISRLAPQKRVFETIKVIEKLQEKYNNLYFIWLGEGPQYREAVNFIKKKGLEVKIFFLGNKRNIYSYLKRIDIFLLLTNYEGLPVSILEAMQEGLPITASNVGGVNEQIIDGINGFLVSNTEDEVLNKLSLLIENAGLRRDFGKSSKTLFEAKFTINKMIEGYRKLYVGNENK